MQNNLARKLNFFPEEEKLQKEVINSLSKTQKELSCKFFYDEYGSKLFDQIVDLEEYYLTRTEHLIMTEHIDEISDFIGERCVLVEPGSGSSNKVRLLLDNLKNTSAYIPIDISDYYLAESASRLSLIYPGINIIPIIADYTQPFNLPDFKFEYENIVIYYPGSTIGNFKPDDARQFLKRLNDMCNRDNKLLIGIDLKKNKDIIERAYNDKEGITKKFNLNILNNLNNKIGSDFNINKWEHVAFYNEKEGRIEMHLKSLENQDVRINGCFINFKKGETVHTENSYKYSIDQFSDLVSEFYDLEKYWVDKDKKFGILLFNSL
ncbi:MAG: L-histidine N(alpha)-methyltransferase [Candidatus Dadabacteria bacterium]|nr:L-histidine N(alpha)-methyltransferase [Candidatus Dadabacteria bacterium]NIQ15219.1 L-histidine N(alpha)-methyltransferase [Candidatus Dadabacteria bacterium]